MEPCSLDATFERIARESWLCRGCNGIKREWQTRPIDITLQSARRLDQPLNHVDGGFPGLICKKLREQLPPSVIDSCLLLGKVIEPSGKKIAEWNSFQGHHRVIIRGTTHVSSRRCGECERICYFAMGKRYLFPPPNPAVELFESDLAGLVMRKELFLSLNLGGWKKFQVDRLAVPTEPPDGLGILTAG